MVPSVQHLGEALIGDRNVGVLFAIDGFTNAQGTAQERLCFLQTAGVLKQAGEVVERQGQLGIVFALGFFVEDQHTAVLAEQIPFYGQRHVIKPGLTGWAQVRYTYGATVEDSIEKLQYDLFYIKHLSVSMDLFIIFETVKTVLLRRGH